MSKTVSVTCDRELDGAPKWVHLLPAGHTKARDGRDFTVDDPLRLVKLFEQEKLDLAIDYEHQNDRPEARASGPVPAAGWIRELASRADGIWGRVDWTARARELIGHREYRYLSPSMLCEEHTGRVLKIKGAGLVHRPALHLTALASQEDTMADDTTLLERLAALLGMSIEDGEEAILDAFEKRLKEGAKPDPSKYVPIEAVEDLMKTRSNENETVKRDRIKQKVETACQKGYITPAMRDWATELCTLDEAQFDTFISKSAPAYGYLMTELCDGQPPHNSDFDIDIDSTVTRVAEQLGITPEQLRDKSW
ncbi:phage protease [Marivita sp. S6314]|uniref:phage protease n=1 Tax=Marivita sp. S6314 TaxID=2926406 RepID=UPI001FF19074|nr:phage protease [Marivita sp. S6314]MCK0150425.1 phage protease [Marivita sp. S6314]